MRVVHATMRYHPGLGGVETYVQELSRRLVARGHQVTVHTSDLERIGQGNVYRRFRAVPTGGQEDGVRIRRHRALVRNGYPYFLIPGLTWSLLKEPADIVHAHNYGYFPADCGALLAALRRKPLVFNPYLMSRVASPFSRLHQATMGRLLMKAGAVVVISGAERRHILALGFRVRRFETVRPGVAVEEFQQPCRPIYRDYGLDGREVVLFVGRLGPQKGADTLVRAVPRILERFPRAAFFIAGPDFGMKEGLVRLAANAGVSASLVFPGPLCRSDLVAAYRQARVFAYPSYAEPYTLSLVQIEAMAAGLPVVGPDCDGTREAIRDGDTGFLVPPHDAAALADRISALLADGALRDRMSRRGQELVRENYSWNRSLPQLEEIYRSLQ